MTTTDPELQLHPEQLESRMSSGEDHHVLDVRSPAEFETAHIPGSLNLPLGQLPGHAAELAEHNELPVVLVCRSRNRAGQAASTLAAAGADRLHVLEGGLQRWDDGARPVQRGKARWDLERQVRLVAGSLVLAGIVVSTKVPRARYLSGAVGAGLAFAAISDTCAMGNLLARLPYNRGAGVDTAATVAALTAQPPMG